MLPQSYELPGALLLIMGGALACFAGHRLFRIVLAIYGFIFGAMLASSIMGVSNTLGMVAGALVGGVVGCVVMMLAWFVGVALVGAGLGALLAHLAWSQIGRADPPAVAVVVASMVGALGAMILQRYVIIVGTAFGGSWTLMVGAANVTALRAATKVSGADDVWILYPLSAMGGRWELLAWLTLGLLGTLVQLAITSRKR
jgi:hypothetical protein